MTGWDELLDEFRALGGTAKNIRLGHGQFGRGIFPVDPARPVSIRIPENLLVAAKDIVFANGIPRVGPSAIVNDRERAWLDRYLQEFGWGGGGIEEVSRMFEMAGTLPAEFRQSLVTKHKCGVWFTDPTDELIRQRFFETRMITYRGRGVMMPIIEMVNHGDAKTYDLSDGVALRGSFPGEVFVRYSDLDTFDYFLSWGFATPRPVAFSIALEGQIGSTRLRIGQDFNERVTSERSWIPDMFRKGDTISLPFLMLGSEGFTRLPRGIFYRLMRSAGQSGFEEAFDMVRHLNRLHFLDLIQDLEGFDLPIARTLRTMACYHLRAMSFCVGVHEI